jgi:hypothetical protein
LTGFEVQDPNVVAYCSGEDWGVPMEAHSQIDWSTLLVGIVLGIPITIVITYVISIVAILHAPRLAQFLDRRKLLKQTKTKKQALAGFNRVKSFRDGTRDRYPFYILLASGAIICATVALAILSTLAVQVGSISSISSGDLIVGLTAVIIFLFAVVLLFGIYETARQIERFDAYKLEFETRWGSVDSSE